MSFNYTLVEAILQTRSEIILCPSTLKGYFQIALQRIGYGNHHIAHILAEHPGIQLVALHSEQWPMQQVKPLSAFCLRWCPLVHMLIMFGSNYFVFGVSGNPVSSQLCSLLGSSSISACLTSVK